MAEETNGSNSPSRLDRIERIVEVLANSQQVIEDEFARLLRAQVVMGEALTKLAEAQKRTEESLKHTDERMDALILTVDEIIRGRKPE